MGPPHRHVHSGPAHLPSSGHYRRPATFSASSRSLPSVPGPLPFPLRSQLSLLRLSRRCARPAPPAPLHTCAPSIHTGVGRRDGAPAVHQRAGQAGQGPEGAAGAAHRRRQGLLNDDNIADIQAEYEGPAGTPFEGGLFRMRLAIGPEFPNAPPKGYFSTKIFHPNVSASGEICVNVLKRDWKPDLGLRHVLTVIRCLLIEPNAESALNEEAGKLLLEGFEEFAKKARLMTSIHAKKPSVLTAAGGANAVNADGTAAAADGKPAGGTASGSGAAAAAGGAAKPSKAAASKLAEKKKSLKRL